MAGDRVEIRRQSFKTRGLTGDESRRRREEASIEIRKVKREESLNKKRMADGAGMPSDTPVSDDDMDELSISDKDSDVSIECGF
jgi:importin subunit alpha-6/7